MGALRRAARAGLLIGVVAVATGATAPAPAGVERFTAAVERRAAGVERLTAGVERAAAGVEDFGAVAWRFETGAAVRSSAALHGGTLYVGSSDHHLYAIDAAVGAEQWRFLADAAVTSSPAVDEQRVVFADRDGTIYALARDGGELLWRVDTGGELPLPWGHEGWDYFTASPTLAGGRVLIGAGDGVLRALDLVSGAELWRFDAGARIRTTPAVVDGLALFGDAAGIFHAVETAGGAERWRFETAGHTLTAADVGFDRRQIYSSAAVHDGTVYFGSRDAMLYALDLADGRELWRAGDGTSAWVISSPAVVGGRVYSARSSSTNVRALDAADGRELWTVATGAAVFSSPVVVDDTVYLGNGAGWVMALDAADGTVRWRYRTGGGVWGTPVVDGDRLYVGSDDGNLYAFERTDGAQPHRAVYWQDEVPFSILALNEIDRPVRARFERFGYEVLSDATLADFFRSRIADRVPSVVVFAVDHLPADVVEEPLEDALYRRYLDAGGKIVWLGAPPSFYRFDPEAGQVTGIDEERSAALLGVDVGDYRSDVYPVRPTSDGLRWGLRSSWVGSGGFPAEQVGEVLAVDELGRVVCWARNYGGPEGTGWVFLRPTSDNSELDEIRAVAEYGVMRTPPREHE